LGQNLELAAIKVFPFAFGVSDDEENDVLGSNLIIDDSGATSLTPTFGRSAEFAKAATAGNQVARCRLDDELHLHLQDVGFGQKTRGRLLEGGESDEFHSGTVRHWRI
jgi:hypothetical protein